MLMAVPGLFTSETRLSLVLMAAGCLFLLIATAQKGVSKPETALLLLISSNLSFWLSYGLWLLRPKLMGPPRTEGIDPFAGPVAFWLLVLVIFAIYEAVTFLVGMTRVQQRKIASVGLAAVVLQVLVTMRTVYNMVKGI
jgi:uncharacterized membrane protein (DUF373 family)